MTDLTTTDCRNDEIAVLIDEARALLERLDDFARRAHKLSGPLERDRYTNEARWPGVGDKISDEFYKIHPRYDELHHLCWKLEATAVAAVSEDSILIDVDWLKEFERETEDMILADPKAKADFKRDILERRQHRAAVDQHSREMREKREAAEAELNAALNAG